MLHWMYLSKWPLTFIRLYSGSVNDIYGLHCVEMKDGYDIKRMDNIGWHLRYHFKWNRIKMYLNVSLFFPQYYFLSLLGWWQVVGEIRIKIVISICFSYLAFLLSPFYSPDKMIGKRLNNFLTVIHLSTLMFSPFLCPLMISKFRTIFFLQEASIYHLLLIFSKIFWSPLLNK